MGILDYVLLGESWWDFRLRDNWYRIPRITIEGRMRRAETERSIAQLVIETDRALALRAYPQL